MRSIFTILALLLMVSVVSAGELSEAPPKSTSQVSGIGVKPAASPWSLLDMSRISWSHSYSVSFFSGGGTSSSVGLLQTSMLYDISDKLKLTVNLGMLHNPSALWNDGDSNARFLPGFRLDFRPSDKVSMTLEVQQVAGYYMTPYGYSGYRSVAGPWFLR